MEEEKVQGETSGPGFGHTIPYEFSALCFSLSHKIPITSFPYWALFVKCIKGTQQTVENTKRYHCCCFVVVGIDHFHICDVACNHF